jgi:hypothetical protein
MDRKIDEVVEGAAAPEATVETPAEVKTEANLEDAPF